MPVPQEGNEPAPTEMVVVPEGKIPAAPFESQTYVNETVGFALDYPASWAVVESALGERASRTLLVSSPEIAELAELPEGATRVAVVVYQWERDAADYVLSPFDAEEREAAAAAIAKAAAAIQSIVLHGLVKAMQEFNKK